MQSIPGAGEVVFFNRITSPVSQPERGARSSRVHTTRGFSACHLAC